MMAQVDPGKVVLINGPPYSGKTYLIAQLLEDLKGPKVVNYERFFRRGGYPEFYKEIVSLAKSGHLVIAESANSYVGHDHKNAPDLMGLDCLHVEACPPLSLHEKNYDRYKKLVGGTLARARIGYVSVSDIRAVTKRPKNSHIHIYNGSNLKEIKEVVLSHAICNEQNYCEQNR